VQSDGKTIQQTQEPGDGGPPGLCHLQRAFLLDPADGLPVVVSEAGVFMDAMVLAEAWGKPGQEWGMGYSESAVHRDDDPHHDGAIAMAESRSLRSHARPEIKGPRARHQRPSPNPRRNARCGALVPGVVAPGGGRPWGPGSEAGAWQGRDGAYGMEWEVDSWATWVRNLTALESPPPDFDRAFIETDDSPPSKWAVMRRSMLQTNSAAPGATSVAAGQYAAGAER